MQKLTLLALLGLVGASGGCASAQAKAPAERPNLDVPAPPTRMIEPTPSPELTQPEPVPELPPAPAAPRPRQTPNRESARPEAKPEAPAADAPAAAPVAPVTPPPQLRTATTADAAEAEKQVRTIMDSANKSLAAINFQRLNKGQREQYDIAKRMITQSEEKLKESKIEIALDYATKADKIARELPVR
jgi:hypothetical protein